MLGYILAGKGIVRAGYENKKWNGISEAVMEIKRIFNAAQFLRYRSLIRMNIDSMEFINGDNLLEKIKDRAYLINKYAYSYACWN